MIFTAINIEKLKAMRIVPEIFSDSLESKHSKDAHYFDVLLGQLSVDETQELTAEHFNEIIKHLEVSDNSLIFNQLYDLFNYIRLYREGGVFKLFKERQAEWGGPKVTITESDVPLWNSGELEEPITIYRGMSRVEYDSGNFGQSWTIKKEVAHRFATDTYCDEESGVVVKTIVNIESILYFDCNDCEGEVIVNNGSILKTAIELLHN
ncbi:MAG: hypothetical protein H7832_15360 [Magnetococcus sp. DMHC-6]